MRAVGRSREELAGAGLGYALSAVAALVTSYALARIMRWADVDDLWNGALVGILVWIGFVATVLAVTTYFGGRPRELWLINAGYRLVALTLMGRSTASGTSPSGSSAREPAASSQRRS